MPEKWASCAKTTKNQIYRGQNFGAPGAKNTYEGGSNCGKIHFAAPEPGRREKEKQHSNIALRVLRT
jgi:hypothetical protein